MPRYPREGIEKELKRDVSSEISRDKEEGGVFLQSVTLLIPRQTEGLPPAIQWATVRNARGQNEDFSTEDEDRGKRGKFNESLA